jgi:hypothetical protein
MGQRPDLRYASVVVNANSREEAEFKEHLGYDQRFIEKVES